MSSSSPRLISLDAYRGFIMICLSWSSFGLGRSAKEHLKVEPAHRVWQFFEQQFNHAEWVGCTCWDLIMPSFLFMVGVAMPFSFARRVKEGSNWGQLLGHTIVRSMVLILLGIFIQYYDRPDKAWDFANTLSQIGLCYLLVFGCWGRSPRVQLAVGIGAVIVTWLIMILHGGSAQLGFNVTSDWATIHHADISQAWFKNANALAEFDRWFLNLFPRAIEFKGSSGGYTTLNVLPAMLTMIAGLMCGEWFRRTDRTPIEKIRALMFAGSGLLAAGYLAAWTGVCPLIKPIWSPSFSLVSTGWCVLLQAIFYELIDVRGSKWWTFPLIVAGSNSILLYIMDSLLKGWTANNIWKRYLGQRCFEWFGAANAPILQYCAVGFTFWLFCWWLYRQKIFVKI